MSPSRLPLARAAGPLFPTCPPHGHGPPVTADGQRGWSRAPPAMPVPAAAAGGAVRSAAPPRQPVGGVARPHGRPLERGAGSARRSRSVWRRARATCPGDTVLRAGAAASPRAQPREPGPAPSRARAARRGRRAAQFCLRAEAEQRLQAPDFQAVSALLQLRDRKPPAHARTPRASRERGLRAISAPGAPAASLPRGCPGAPVGNAAENVGLDLLACTRQRDLTTRAHLPPPPSTCSVCSRRPGPA